METRRLDELCVQIIDCPHSTPQWLSSGKLVLRNFNIHNGRIDLSDVSYLILMRRHSSPETSGLHLSPEILL